MPVWPALPPRLITRHLLAPAGLVLAAEANRSLVLPDFLLNGIQPDGIETVTAEKTDSVPFGCGSACGPAVHLLLPQRAALALGSTPC